MDNKKVLKKTDKIVTREIEGEVILLPLYKSSKEMNYIYTLNQTAAAFWDNIDGKKTLGAIKEKMLGAFDVDEATLSKEIDGLIKDFKSINAIV